jgi:hypothetical protein
MSLLEIIVMSVTSIVCVYLWFRNEFVYNTRVNCSDNNHKYYDYLPSYNDMYITYWYIWSEEKFLQMAKEKYNEHSRVE